ncbi:hypothetical protein AGMMS49982_10300 [Bacteroidia bacterium]|nr:hypothetical protein AGMMS49982_10300 [Bacteroidia bacterium]
MNEISKINPVSMKQPTKAYSNGILVPLGNANMLFVTGQVAQDNNGNVVAPNDFTAQTRFIFEHIGEILKDADMTFDDVVKAQIFVTDMGQSSKVSAIRDEFFANSKPASTLVEINKLVKAECCVEIEVIAVKLITNRNWCMQNSKIHHISINVSDLVKSQNFYQFLGFCECHNYCDDSVKIKHFSKGDFILELFCYSSSPTTKTVPKEIEHSEFVGIEHFSLHTDNIESVYNLLKNHIYNDKGIQLGRTGIRFFFITDPDGNRIEIVEDKRRILQQ